MTQPVPVHAEAVPGQPGRARWVVPVGVLSFVGVPDAVPSPLALLLDAGTLASLEVQPGAVVIDLGPGRSWAAEGETVRVALQQALADPAGWRPPADATPEAALAAAVRSVLDGEVGDYARSHGGSLELVAVHDGIVDIALHGTCDGCPAAGRTLEDRVLAGVRALDPGVREVRSVHDASTPATGPGGRRLLPMLFRRG